MHPKPKQKKKLNITIDSTDLELYIEIPQTRPTHTHTHTKLLQVQETMKHTSTQTWPTQIWSLNSSNLRFFFRRRCSKTDKSIDQRKSRKPRYNRTSMWQTASGTEKHKSYTDRRIAKTKNGQKKLQSLPQYLYPLETDRPTVSPTPPPPASSTRKLDLSFCCIVSSSLYKTRRRRTLRSSAALQWGPIPGSLDSRQNRLLPVALPGQIYQIVDSNPRQHLPQSTKIVDLKSRIVPMFPMELGLIPGSSGPTTAPVTAGLIAQSNLPNHRFQFGYNNSHNLPKL
jgi:hypothetical protein